MQYLFFQMYNNKKKRKGNKSLNRKDLIPLYKIELESSCNSFQVHRMYMYLQQSKQNPFEQQNSIHSQTISSSQTQLNSVSIFPSSISSQNANRPCINTRKVLLSNSNVLTSIRLKLHHSTHFWHILYNFLNTFYPVFFVKHSQ